VYRGFFWFVFSALAVLARGNAVAAAAPPPALTAEANSAPTSASMPVTPSAASKGAPAAAPVVAHALPDNLTLPQVGLQTKDLALIVNDADPVSVETARYYAERRAIAADRVIHVRFTPGLAAMSQAEFALVQQQLQATLPADVQAYALAWTLPYRVDCMSVTSAFAFGFQPEFCATGCQTTKPSPYFNSNSNAPFSDHRLRPAMLLAGKDLAHVKALIDRGVRSDQRWPVGTGYLLNTSDRKRNVRAESYGAVQRGLVAAYPVKQVNADALEGASDVMFYFTGSERVAGIGDQRFLDGAVADHLTSLGGMLINSTQMSALDWLSAGATGSYGSTSEPCNYRAKFPEIGVLMGRYLGGETLIEAYWKSVRMPGQGVFIGEPLARPFSGVRVARDASRNETAVRTRTLRPGAYALQVAPGRIGPFKTVGQLVVPGYGVREVRLPAAATGYFRLMPVSQ
jgi:uncharacterized protein (TIGR03790 family)